MAFSSCFQVCIVVIALSLSLVELSQAAPTLIASLDYGTFEGAYSDEYNISYWQKIPFAAPPIGRNRFRGPQPPANITNGTYDSSQSFDMCPQRTVNGSEDCLYLGLYSRPWSAEQSLRPVVVVFFGGGFIQGSAFFTLPPSAYPILNVSTSNDIVIVYPNYRTNAFGFLPGKEIGSDPFSDTNAGLLDQQAALQWTNKYISEFGGDPSNVTIWGQSAGGGSVLSHVIANGGKTSPSLFSKALASSPYWPKSYHYDAPEAQSQYDSLVSMTGCSHANNTLTCLKALPVQTIRNASLAISSSHTYTTSSYTWGPVLDDTFLTQPLSQATLHGDVNIDYGFGMYNEFEGENFIPGGLNQISGSNNFNNSEAGFDFWLAGFLPRLSDSSIARLKDTYYPANGTAEVMGAYNGTYARAQLVYRDLILACPAYWMALSAKSNSYVGEYTIAPAKHASDTVWVRQLLPIPIRIQPASCLFL